MSPFIDKCLQTFRRGVLDEQTKIQHTEDPRSMNGSLENITKQGHNPQLIIQIRSVFGDSNLVPTSKLVLTYKLNHQLPT